MVTYFRTQTDCASQPFRYQPLGKFTLRIFIVEARQRAAGLQRTFHVGAVFAVTCFSREPAVKPQSRPNSQRAAEPAAVADREYKLLSPNQVGMRPQQPLAFPQRFPYEPDLAMLQ